MTNRSTLRLLGETTPRGFEVLTMLPIMAAALLGCSDADPIGPEAASFEDGAAVSSELGTLEQPLACTGSGACEATMSRGHTGTWPNGQIKYIIIGPFAFQALVRTAMDDWESATNNVIAFQQVESYYTGRHVIIEEALGSVGEAPGYDGCPDVCGAYLNAGNAYHELGHIIGFVHHQQRYDRRHYEIVNDARPCRTPAEQADDDCVNGMIANPCSDGNVARTSSPDAMGMFGPFDFDSTMHYAVTHPDFTRWDGSSIEPDAVCNDIGHAFDLPPQCVSGTDCLGTNCDPTKGMCPTCVACRKAQPNGLPTKGDGAAVVEMYLSAAYPRWKVAKRAVREDAPYYNQPFDYRLNTSTNAKIGKFSSLSAAADPDGSRMLYATGNDWHVYGKTITATPYITGWGDLGAIPGVGPVSDPASVSWGAGRRDVVVRRGSTLYIRTDNGTAWTSWQSLGTPGSNPADSPAITSWGPNRLDVFVRGIDRKLYWRNCSANCLGSAGTWSAWAAIPGGTFRGKPAALARKVGFIDVFVHGDSTDKIWGVAYRNNSWGNYYVAQADTSVPKTPESLCEECSSPAVMSRGPNLLDIIVRGKDDQMWMTSWSESTNVWTPYMPIGGVLVSAPTGISSTRTTDRADVFAVMAEEREYGNVVYGPWWKQYTQ